MSTHYQNKDHTALPKSEAGQFTTNGYWFKWSVEGSQSPKLNLSPCRLLLISTLSAVCLLFAGTSLAQSSTPQTGTSPASINTPSPQVDDGRMTREEILALFQREARAAYQMNKLACEGLADEPKKICLAKARLQFDEDMRYAKKRAELGY